MSIRDMIKAARDNNFARFDQHFEKEIKPFVADALASKKIEVASKIYNEDFEQIEEKTVEKGGMEFKVEKKNGKYIVKFDGNEIGDPFDNEREAMNEIDRFVKMSKS